MGRTILYYTRPCYLDAALEYIDIAKNFFDIHVVIQISPAELKSNIFNIDADLSNYKSMIPLKSVIKDWKLEFLDQYFYKCKSVNFLKFNGGPKDLLLTSFHFSGFIHTLKPDHLHFDDFTGKQLLILPILYKFRKKVILNIHDPKAHTGEGSLSKKLIQKVLYNLPKKIVVFSKFSQNLLTKKLNKNISIFLLRLLPYTVFKNFGLLEKSDRTLISFVGRLSPYKGIDIFIDSIAKVLETFPQQKFLIAGKSLFGYKMDTQKIELLKTNLTVVDKHLSNAEIVSYIMQSKAIICPYLDATQSGVVMTAFALGCPVIVSDVGGLPEYILNENVGQVSKAESHSFSQSIIHLLEKNFSDAQESNVMNDFANEAKKNAEVMKRLYS